MRGYHIDEYPMVLKSRNELINEGFCVIIRVETHRIIHTEMETIS